MTSGENVEKRKPMCTVGGNVNWHSLENSMEVPQKIKNRNTVSSNSTKNYIYQKKIKTLIQKDKCHSVLSSMVALSEKASLVSNSSGSHPLVSVTPQNCFFVLALVVSSLFVHSCISL